MHPSATMLAKRQAAMRVINERIGSRTGARALSIVGEIAAWATANLEGDDFLAYRYATEAIRAEIERTEKINEVGLLAVVEYANMPRPPKGGGD